MSQRVAIVTGSSKGLGAATVRLLAQRGFAVVVNYNSDAAGADEIVRQIAAEPGGRAVAVGADVTDPDDVGRLVATTLEAFGRLDVLVCNASFPLTRKPLAELSLAEFETMVHAEMRSAFLLTQAALTPMTAQGGGRLVYISSDHAVGPGAPGMISLGTAKAALGTFAKYVAHEVGRRHITANVVQCGFMATAATQQIPQAFRDGLVARTPLGRLGEAEDVAGAVAFFASEDARFVTGTILPANGGMGLSRFCPPEPAP